MPHSELPNIVYKYTSLAAARLIIANRTLRIGWPNSNLLMWSHYADEHRGVVFGFQPDAARDWFLCLLEPVSYCDVRPSFYKPFDALVGSMPAPTHEAMRAFTNSLTAVQCTQWPYEQELRVVIPSYVPEGQPAVFISYYATGMAELYLGHRVAAGDRNVIVAAARALKKDVAIFQARITAGAYALSFEPIECVE